MKDEPHIPLSNADPELFSSDEPHFLQSEYWAKFQKSLGKKVIKLNQEYYSALITVEQTPIGKYLFVPYGPNLANHTKLKPAVSALKKIAKKEHAIFVRIEPTLCLPQESLRRLGAYKVKDIDPAETWILDFPETKEELLQKLPRRLRGYYNTHESKGIEIIVSHNPEDINHLIKLQKQIFQQKHIKTFSEEYLKCELAQDFATLYLAKYQKNIIAAVLVFDDDEARYYMQAASDKSYAKLNANGILTIQAILDAYKKDLCAFDFWGIAPDGAPDNHPWAGFTTFKKMFAGRSKYYSGTYDIPVDCPRYLVYKALRRLNQQLTKIKGN